MSPLWSLVLTLFGVTGQLFAGRGRLVGWWISLFAQFVWIAYAIVTRQYFFIVGSMLYGTTAVINIRFANKKRREDDTEK